MPIKTLRRKELEEWEKHDIIEKSMSNWPSPILPVKKKDGSLHFPKTNMSKSDAYPMPRVDELLDRVRQARFISPWTLLRGTGRSWWKS